MGRVVTYHDPFHNRTAKSHHLTLPSRNDLLLHLRISKFLLLAYAHIYYLTYSFLDFRNFPIINEDKKKSIAVSKKLGAVLLSLSVRKVLENTCKQKNDSQPAPIYVYITPHLEGGTDDAYHGRNSVSVSSLLTLNFPDSPVRTIPIVYLNVCRWLHRLRKVKQFYDTLFTCGLIFSFFSSVVAFSCLREAISVRSRQLVFGNKNRNNFEMHNIPFDSFASPFWSLFLIRWKITC